MDWDMAATFEPKTDADYEALCNAMIAEMHRLNAQMQRDDEEIEQVKKEIRLRREETRAIIAKLGMRI